MGIAIRPERVQVMNVIPFPKRMQHWHAREFIHDHLMAVAQNTLDKIADDITEVARDEVEMREQLIFVLEKLSSIVEDLKEASGNH